MKRSNTRPSCPLELPQHLLQRLVTVSASTPCGLSCRAASYNGVQVIGKLPVCFIRFWQAGAAVRGAYRAAGRHAHALVPRLALCRLTSAGALRVNLKLEVFVSCAGRLAPLSEGRIEPSDGTLMCSYHGWRFAGDGACIGIPQAPDARAEAAALASPRSCVTMHPAQARMQPLHAISLWVVTSINQSTAHDLVIRSCSVGSCGLRQEVAVSEKSPDAACAQRSWVM